MYVRFLQMNFKELFASVLYHKALKGDVCHEIF